MTHSDLQAWLDRYMEAWRRNEPEPITALFTEDAVYRFRPFEGGQSRSDVDRRLGDGGGSIMWASSGDTFYVYTKPDGGDPALWIADLGG